MSEQQTPERPPTSGPGSGVTAWREYAAAVTDSPLESWAALSREEIVTLLDSEGAAARPGANDEEQPGGLTEREQEADRNAAAARAELAARPRPRPVWMVPIGEGFVPEHELNRRKRKGA